MDFREATDALFACVTHEDLARELNVSVAAVRQARLKPHAQAHRAPPRRWEDAVMQLAQDRAAHYQRLVDNLRRAAEQKPRPQPLGGHPIIS
jgi:hypothetical protein